MSSVTRLPDPACREARERIHALLDGDALEPSQRQRLDEHLGGCSACREFDRDLEALQSSLRDLGSRRLTGPHANCVAWLQ